MRKSDLRFYGALALSLAFLGALISLFYVRLLDFRANSAALPPTPAATMEPVVLYAPPDPRDAPPGLRDLVLYGQGLFNDTQRTAKAYVGNGLTCANCHFQGGITRGGKNGGISLVGVAAVYPKYRTRERSVLDLVQRTGACFQRSMNGTPPPPESREMRALIAYYQWISKGVPLYANVPWLGLPALTTTRAPDAASGRKLFASTCTQCHGTNGQGTLIAPPLWGNRSFGAAAGLNTPAKLAPFLYLNMPRENPTLTPEQATDVAAFVTRQPRPGAKT